MDEQLEHIGDVITELHQEIVNAQYQAARKVNQEMLQLYFHVGARLSEETQKANWGDKVLDQISKALNQSISGLRGFSAQNLKKMRLFYETYAQQTLLGSPVVNSLPDTAIKETVEISSPLVNQLQEHFWDIGFTHHFLIISKTDSLEEKPIMLVRVPGKDGPKGR